MARAPGVRDDASVLVACAAAYATTRLMTLLASRLGMARSGSEGAVLASTPWQLTCPA